MTNSESGPEHQTVADSGGAPNTSSLDAQLLRKFLGNAQIHDLSGDAEGELIDFGQEGMLDELAEPITSEPITSAEPKPKRPPSRGLRELRR